MSVERLHVGPRMSQAVIHGDTVYTAGQVAMSALEKDQPMSMAEQTLEILSNIDSLLAEAGSDKSKLISATIWITDMALFQEMNQVWDAWVAEGNTPCRACVTANLASPKLIVEIMVTAAR
ncbi:MAG: RidA family protein [Rhodovibrionaceae bacterium]